MIGRVNSFTGGEEGHYKILQAGGSAQTNARKDEEDSMFREFPVVLCGWSTVCGVEMRLMGLFGARL